MQVDFVGIDAKIKRAKQHIDEFEREAAGLSEPDAYTLFAYCELDTRHGLLAINIRPAKLTDLSTIIGDVLNNLRGALDHLFHRLLDRHSWTVPGDYYFPIAKLPEHFKAAIKGVKQQVGRDAMKLLGATEAYEGGKGHGLWQLREMNNADKHHLIVPVLTKLQGLSIDVGAGMAARFNDPAIPSLKVTIKPNEEIRGTPLEDGATIIRHTNFPPEVDMNTKPVLDIAFAKGQVVDGEPVLPTLAQLAQLVEDTVEPFRLLP